MNNKIIIYLKLIRYKNLLLLIFMQLLFSYIIVDNSIKTNFNHFIILSLIIFSTIFIAAAGYIINDIFDVETDKINKPTKNIIQNSISTKVAYIIIAIIGIIFGIFASFKTNNIKYSFIFIAISILLYFYSKNLKQKLLIGNFVVSGLIALSILIIPIFYIDTFEHRNIFLHTTYIYAFFAFILNFIREIVKDIEDINGDYSQKMKTLPIVLGRKRTQYIAFALCFIPLFLSVYFAFGYFKNYLQIVIYIFTLIILPLLVFMTKINSAKTKKEYKKLSALLKFVMLFGILSILLIKKIIL